MQTAMRTQGLVAQRVAAPKSRASVKVTAIQTKGKTVKGKTVKSDAVSEGAEYMLGLPGKGFFGLNSNPDAVWDPAGFLNGPTLSISEAKRYREAEITHGRVAMLAALGWLVAEEYHPFFSGVGGTSSFARFQAVEGVFPQFWEVILLGIGICESYRISIGWNNPKDVDQIKEDYEPGFLGFDPLNLLPEDETERDLMITKELNHGRIAMIAIAAFAAQEDVEKNVSIWRELVERDIIPQREAALFPELQ